MFQAVTRLPRWGKALILIVLDMLLGGAAVWAAMLARVGGIPHLVAEHAVLVTVFAMIVVPGIGALCGIYRPVIRFFAPRLSMRIAVVALICGFCLAWVAAMGGAKVTAAAGLGTVFGLMLFPFLILSRESARWLLRGAWRRPVRRVAVYGAGAAGRELVALLRATHEYTPAVFIDDDPSLTGRIVAGISVVNPVSFRFAPALGAYRVDEILLAIPSLTATRRREILNLLSRFSYRVRSVPSLSDLLRDGAKALANLKEISVEDLLGRDPVPPLPGLLEKCVLGKSVLISGGGGSIGNELCRQVAALNPSKLVVLDHSELALYQIEQDLRAVMKREKNAPELYFVLGSVTDQARIERILEYYRIRTVYHAAAYKHVPIVEENPVEGLRNNVLGTWHIARSAASCGVEHFVLVSSDKAVRPTNVMGATKRMAELVVQMLAARHPRTIFSMVRFGNVLGSSGSVVPLFRRQIEQGGPITLTHQEVTRYFMTIPEAVQLVIQAGALAEGGEVFVLDMGEPVKIRDLAEKMVHLSGRTVRDTKNPHGEIAIEMVGLRNGEKLYEELLIGGEATGTAHPRIWRVREENVDGALLQAEISNLQEILYSAPDAVDIRRLLARWVTGYPSNGGELTSSPRNLESKAPRIVH